MDGNEKEDRYMVQWLKGNNSNQPATMNEWRIHRPETKSFLALALKNENLLKIQIKGADYGAFTFGANFENSIYAVFSKCGRFRATGPE